jgi:hypothetical protein
MKPVTCDKSLILTGLAVVNQPNIVIPSKRSAPRDLSAAGA